MADAVIEAFSAILAGVSLRGITDNGHGAKPPENPTDTVLSGQKGTLTNGCTKPLRGSFLAVMRCSGLSCDTLSCPSIGG